MKIAEIAFIAVGVGGVLNLLQSGSSVSYFSKGSGSNDNDNSSYNTTAIGLLIQEQVELRLGKHLQQDHNQDSKTFTTNQTQTHTQMQMQMQSGNLAQELQALKKELGQHQRQPHIQNNHTQILVDQIESLKKDIGVLRGQQKQQTNDIPAAASDGGSGGKEEEGGDPSASASVREMERITNRMQTTDTSGDIQWPEMDDRVAQSIRDGVLIVPETTVAENNDNKNDGSGKEYYMFNDTKHEAPTKGLATVVSCYYDAKSKHPSNQYGDWFAKMLTATDPMIIFLDHTRNFGVDWLDFVETRRQHAPTVIAKFPFHNLTMNTRFERTFWTKHVPIGDKTFKWESYTIYNEKTLLMKYAAKMNPFQTDEFLWIDAGYFRGRYDMGHAPIVRNNITSHGVQADRMLFQNIFLDPAKQELAAGAFGGTAEAIYAFNDKYWFTFWDMVKKGLMVTFEQRVFVSLCRTWPRMCHIVHAGEDKDWFAMGKNMLRSSTFDFSKVKVELQTPFNESLQPTTIVEDISSEFPEGIVTGSNSPDVNITFHAATHGARR